MMPFVIKWIPQDTGTVVADPHRFDHLGEALDHACAPLGARPTDIWVENELGIRVAGEHRIIEHCKARDRLKRG